MQQSTHTLSAGSAPILRRAAGGLAAGLGACLALSGCGMGGGAPAESSPHAPSATPTVTETATPTATATVTESASASPTASGSGSAMASSSASGGPLAGPTQTYTTESGIFTVTLPEDWTVEVEEDAGEGLHQGTVPYEIARFSDPQGLLTVGLATGLGETHNDGWKPTPVDVVEAEELTELPVAEGYEEGGFGTGPVYFRTAVLTVDSEAPEPAGQDDVPEVGDYLLDLEIVNLTEGADPTDVEDYYSSWQYLVDPPAGAGEGEGPTSNILSATIDQDAAEEITGLQGEKAVRALVDTEEYATLRAVLTSVEVDLD